MCPPEQLGVEVLMQRKILLMNRSEVRETLEWGPLLDVARSALIGLDIPDAPESVSTQLAVPAAALHVKGGAVTNPAVLALKANLRPDSGNSDGAVLVFDLAEQRLRAILASGDITAMRTAAMAASAMQVLVTAKDPIVALLGAGPVAQYVDQALAHLGLGSELRVWSRSQEHAQWVVDQGDERAQRRTCASVAKATDGADLVVTCTPARTPLLNVGDLAPQAVVLAMGADSPGKRELGEGIFNSASLFADVPADALSVGEFAHLPRSDANRINSLGTLLSSGQHPDGAGRVIFDSVGSSAVDAAVSAMVVDRAVETGCGNWINF